MQYKKTHLQCCICQKKNVFLVLDVPEVQFSSRNKSGSTCSDNLDGVPSEEILMQDMLTRHEILENEETQKLNAVITEETSETGRVIYFLFFIFVMCKGCFFCVYYDQVRISHCRN